MTEQYPYRASLQAAAAQREMARTHPLSFRKADLIQGGLDNWERSYKLTRNQDEALRLLLTWHADRSLPGGVNGADYFCLPNIQISTLGAALWCDCGFPQVVMGHKQCATLLSSHIAADVIAELRAPWPAFLIEVPRGLVFALDDLRASTVSVTAVLVTTQRFETVRWSYIAFTESSITLWRHGLEAKHLRVADETPTYDTTPYSEAITDIDCRAQELLGRLIAGVCLSMSDPTKYVDKGASSKPKAKGNQRESSEPKTRTYVLETTTTIDCREAVSGYARGGGGGVPKVQIMVAGHWRHQAYGPGSKLRKLIHIDPHWRNSADLPILVKPHRL